MAHANIYERYKKIKQLMGDKWCSRKANIIKREFDCSVGAVYSSFIEINRGERELLYPSPSLKKRVIKRDLHTCQYCGDNSGLIIAEHVVPLILGGVGNEYNLVASCQSCNVKKKKRVFVPKNIDVLAKLNPDWARNIIEKAR